MTFMDWLRSVFAPRKEIAPALRQQPAARSPQPRMPTAGRVSMDAPEMMLGDTWIVMPPQDYESLWRTLNLDAAHLDTYSPKELLDMLAELSPEVSRALWDFLRLCNPGWECKAFVLGSEDTEDAAAQAATDMFLDHLRDQYGSTDIIFGRLFTGAFMRGAFCAELVLDRGRIPVDLATPDPYSIRFRKRKDPIRGEVWQPGQWQQGGDFVRLDIPTFKILPIDPMPGVPYGRPLVAPALFTGIFLISLLHDVKRVVMQQGYKRMDIILNTEQLIPLWQQAGTDSSLLDFVAAQMDAVRIAYESLEPDDAFIHTDLFTIGVPTGTVDMDSIGAIDKIIEKLERMATRALKSNSLLMGNDESASETDSNRRWEIHVAGIKAIQHYCENMLESLLTLALQAQGMQARIEFRFAELRAAEMLRDAQVDQLKVANAATKRDQGWWTQDEASNEVVGHDAVEETSLIQQHAEQALQAAKGGDGDGQERNDGGNDRNRYPINPINPNERVSIIPDGASDPLVPIPDEVTISDSEVERAIADWDELMPDYAGLLDAQVFRQQQEGEERALYIRTASPWLWDATSHRYRNTSTGQYVGQKQMTELRDRFVDAKRETAQQLAADLATGAKSLQEFEVAFRREIKTVFVDQYVLAKGGRNSMTQSDWGTTGQMIREQYMYARDFALDIASGKLSQAQIAQRAGLYFDSSTRAFEQGRSASYGTPTLPEYPADGRQKCRSRCKCRWDIKETDDAWECSWRLNPTAEHCESCAENANRWSPLTILKAGRGIEHVERILEHISGNGYH